METFEIQDLHHGPIPASETNPELWLFRLPANFDKSLLDGLQIDIPNKTHAPTNMKGSSLLGSVSALGSTFSLQVGSKDELASVRSVVPASSPGDDAEETLRLAWSKMSLLSGLRRRPNQRTPAIP
mmetsp:Transcript_1896/g.2297  ORF Transcript_1896/g.2297 Transcript_1896/m.2297 type:complete len:126 (-) Transcript_1896:559-936(-)